VINEYGLVKYIKSEDRLRFSLLFFIALSFSLAVSRSLMGSRVNDIGKTSKKQWFLRRGVKKNSLEIYQYV